MDPEVTGTAHHELVHNKLKSLLYLWLVAWNRPNGISYFSKVIDDVNTANGSRTL